jgi:FkbM family methyltransferase
LRPFRGQSPSRQATVSTFGKIGTVLRLLCRRDWHLLKTRLQLRTAAFRMRRHHGRAFVYHDLGFPFAFLPDWPDSVENFCSGTGDFWELGVIRRWLEPGDIAIDGGANLGLYAFAAADRVGRSGRSVAVDASPFIVDKLGETAGLLDTPQVESIHAAITREPGALMFYVRPDRHHTSGQSLRPSPGDRAACVPVEVAGLTLSDLARSLNLARMPAFVKIDVEGADAAALASAPPEWFGRGGPLWIVEINPGALANFGDNPEAVTRHFSPEAFECWLLSKHPVNAGAPSVLQPLTPASNFTDSRYYNLVAIPKRPDRPARAGRIRRCFPAS